MQAEAIHILSVDRTQDGAVIAFSDGTTTFYPTPFLYSARAQPGGRENGPRDLAATKEEKQG